MEFGAKPDISVVNGRTRLKFCFFDAYSGPTKPFLVRSCTFVEWALVIGQNCSTPDKAIDTCIDRCDLIIRIQRLFHITFCHSLDQPEVQRDRIKNTLPAIIENTKSGIEIGLVVLGKGMDHILDNRGDLLVLIGKKQPLVEHVVQFLWEDPRLTQGDHLTGQLLQLQKKLFLNLRRQLFDDMPFQHGFDLEKFKEILFFI